MNVDTLVAWGVKVLKWLDEPRPTGRELDADVEVAVVDRSGGDDDLSITHRRRARTVTRHAEHGVPSAQAALLLHLLHHARVLDIERG